MTIERSPNRIGANSRGCCRRRGRPTIPQGVETLIDGVLAAPAEVGTSWHMLVADPMTPELAERARGAAGGQGEGVSRRPLGRGFRTAAARRRGSAVCARSWQPEGSTGSSCRAPTSIRANTFRPAASGSPGSPALPDRPVWRSCCAIARRCSSMAATRLQAAAQVDAQSVRDPSPDRRAAGALDRHGARRQEPCSATTRGCTPRTRSSGFAPRPKRPARCLRAVAENPLDRVWPGRPAAPIAPVVPHPERFAGESAQSKRARLGRALAEEGAAAAVLTMPESIAWLLNIRGGDVPHTPLPLSFAILRQDGSVTLFIDRRKLAPGLERHLGNAVTIDAARALGPALDALAAEGGAGAGRSGDRGVLGLRPARRQRARRSTAPPIPACCPRPARTRSSSTARARRIAATAPR